MNNKKTICIIIVLLLVSVAFYLGRLSINTDPVIEYVKGETIRDTVKIEKLVSYKEETPKDPSLPTKKDTIIEYRDIFVEGKTKTVIDTFFISSVDTSAIINNYIKKRFYNPVLFDDKEKGYLALDLSVQYNELKNLSYVFTPVHQRQTIIKKRVFIPFASGSYSTLNYVGLGGGVFYYDLGFEYQYQIGYNGLSNGHSFGLKYKF